MISPDTPTIAPIRTWMPARSRCAPSCPEARHCTANPIHRLRPAEVQHRPEQHRGVGTSAAEDRARILTLSRMLWYISVSGLQGNDIVPGDKFRTRLMPATRLSRQA